MHAGYQRPSSARTLPAAVCCSCVPSSDPQRTRPTIPSHPPSAASEPGDQPDPLPHSDTTRYFIAGQANIIFQAHGPFHSPYEGTNSLLGRGEYKTSLLGTLFLAASRAAIPATNTDFISDVESAGGRGICEALGLAGFTNLDVVRNPNLGPVPYLARVQLHQTIGLTNEITDADRTPFSLATQVPSAASSSAPAK